MLTRLSCCILIGLLILATPQPASAQPRVDRYGDPLPPGAKARLGTTRLLQDAPTTGVYFSADGNTLITTGEEHAGVRLWDATTGKAKKTLRQEDMPPLLPGAQSSDGKRLACAGHFGGKDDFLFIRDLDDGGKLSNFRIPGIPSHVAFVDGDKTLVTLMEKGAVHWWDAATGKEKRTWQPPLQTQTLAETRKPVPLFGFALSPDAKLLAVGYFPSKSGKEMDLDVLVVWDTTKGDAVWRIKQDGWKGAQPFAFSPDGKWLVLVDTEQVIHIREARSGNAVGKSQRKGETRIIEGLTFSPDSTCLAITWNTAEVEICNLPGVGSLQYLVLPDSDDKSTPIYPVRFSPTADRLAVPRGRTCYLFDVRTGKELLALEGHKQTVHSLQFENDDTLISVAGPDSIIFASLLKDGRSSRRPLEDRCRWEFRANKLTRSFPGLDDKTVVYSYSLSLRLILNAPGNLAIVDEIKGSTVKVQTEKVPSHAFFTADGRALIMRDDNTQERQAYDVSTGRFLLKLAKDPETLSTTFTPDLRLAAVVQRDGTVAIINTATGKVLQELHAFGDRSPFARPVLLFSPDGNWLFTWQQGESELRTWRVLTGRPGPVLPVKPLQVQAIVRGAREEIALALSPDGKMLALCGDDGREVQVWELATMKLRRRFTGPTGLVTALAFSPDGRWLASGSQDTTVVVWDLWGPP
jgi:WD40 repeat protein